MLACLLASSSCRLGLGFILPSTPSLHQAWLPRYRDLRNRSTLLLSWRYHRPHQLTWPQLTYLVSGELLPLRLHLSKHSQMKSSWISRAGMQVVGMLVSEHIELA